MNRQFWSAPLLVLMIASPQVARSGYEENMLEAVVEDGYILEPIPNGDGTFSWLIPAELALPPDEARGAVTWTYVGQADHAIVVDAKPWIDDGDPLGAAPDTVGELKRSMRADRFGRLWAAVDVDEKLLSASIAAYDAEHGSDIDEVGAEMKVARDEPPGGTVLPLAWNEDDCGLNEYHHWGTDDRDQLGTLNMRRRPVVVLTNGGFHEPDCTAVMIDDHVALTAAHCISTDGSHPYSPTGSSVCSKGVWAYDSVGEHGVCLEVDSFLPHPDYNGSSMNTDIGLIFLDTTFDFSADVGDYALSGTSDARIEDLTPHNLAYPPWWNSDPCAFNYAVDEIGTYAAWLVFNDDIVTDVTNKKVGTHIDSGNGHSGSPIYYCPFGDEDFFCEGTEEPFVIAVMSGWFTDGVLNNYNGGPKVPYYRSWIIGEM